MADIGISLDRDDLILQQGRDFKWAFDNTDEDGNPAPYPAGELYFELLTGGEHNCVQQVEILKAEGGSYKLDYDGTLSDPIDYYEADDSPYDLTIDIRSALENIPAIGAGNVEVTTAGLTPVWHFNLTLAGTSQNEIQELSVVNLLGWLGEQLGEGQMVLSYRNNDAETPISFEANAATIQASLESIPQIGIGNVVVTEPVADHFHIEFVGLLAARDIDLIKVRAYEKNATDFFGGGVTGNLLTQFSTKTIQNGRRAILDGRMMANLTKIITDFFNLFDDSLSLGLSFNIKDNTHFTVICKSNKGYEEIDLVTFDVLFNATMAMTYFNNVVFTNGAVSTVTIDQYWNYRYNVEFINDAGNKPHPRLIGNASGLTNTITDVTLVPEIETSVIDLGRAAITKWPFVIDGTAAGIKVESETVDTIANRTLWYLVWKPAGEPAGGDPVARGQVLVQR